MGARSCDVSDLIHVDMREAYELPGKNSNNRNRVTSNTDNFDNSSTMRYVSTVDIPLMGSGRRL